MFRLYGRKRIIVANNVHTNSGNVTCCMYIFGIVCFLNLGAIVVPYLFGEDHTGLDESISSYTLKAFNFSII